MGHPIRPRPTAAHRCCFAVLVAMSAVGIAACEPSAGDPMAACTDDTSAAGEPGDAAPLLILGDPYLTPTIVYADGAVVVPMVADAGDAAAFLRPPMMAPGYTGDQPGGFEAGVLSDCELAVVTDLADELFTDDVDFGSPQVTDMGSTPVTYAGRSFSVYAFSRQDPGEYGGLSGVEERARADLADLWDAVEQADEPTDELGIDRMFLHFYAEIEDASAVDWPLATPVSELSQQPCVTVAEPEQVQAMLDRLAGGDDLLVDDERRLAVLAAAPGVPDCET